MIASRAILLTNADLVWNQSVSTHLLNQGCMVSAIFSDRLEADRYTISLTASCQDRFFPLLDQGVGSSDTKTIRGLVDQAALHMGGLHHFIHGVLDLDEAGDYEASPIEFGRETLSRLRSNFLYSRAAASHMMRKKAGHIVYLLHADTLYHAGYRSAPVHNQGTIAMMKTMAKELSPFRVAVNAITFGYYKLPPDEKDKLELKQQLEIHALKPYIPEPEEMVLASVDWVLGAPERLVSGQNIHIGAGMDTAI